MKYLATTTVSFGPGTRLGLTKDQAAARAHALTAAGRGQYITRTAVQFKAGEVFNFDGEMPKGLADLVASPAAASPPPPPPAPLAPPAGGTEPPDGSGTTPPLL